MSAYSLRPDSQSMALVVVSALVQSHHQSIQNCLFLMCPSLSCLPLCDVCHLLLRHHLILSFSVSSSMPSFNLSHPLFSSSTLVLQFSLSKHCQVHLLSTLPQSGQTKVNGWLCTLRNTWPLDNSVVWKYSAYMPVRKHGGICAKVHLVNLLSNLCCRPIIVMVIGFLFSTAKLQPARTKRGRYAH